MPPRRESPRNRSTLSGKIGFVRPRAVVTRAARADRQTHAIVFRLRGSYPGSLEAFDVHGPIGALAAGFHGGTPRAFGQERTDPVSSGNRVNGGQDAFCVSEAQSECRASGSKPFSTVSIAQESVPPVLIASRSVVVAETGRLQDAVGIADAAQRSPGEQRLVLEPLLFACLGFEEPLTADGARGTAVPAAEGGFGQSLATERIGMLERGLLEIAGWATCQGG